MDRLIRQAEKRVGTVLRERWTIDALIGVGGMAAVYRATHRNGNEVAIKILHSDISDNTAIKQRFQREGYVANRVKHRGAVTVFDDDTTEDGCAFLVMELLIGENVEARRERLGGFVPLSEVLGIADQVLDTLAAAHEKGIIHRDVKPENLFLTTEGVVKVLDFGIARLESAAIGPGLTLPGAMLGTPGFMPPEQALGAQRDVDHQSDIWGMGATLFTLLCGQFVHHADTLNETMIYAATKPAPSLASVLPDLDPGVVALVDKALCFKKRDRWPDALSMQRELRRVAARVLSGGRQGSMEALELALSEPLSVPGVPSEPEPATRVLPMAKIGPEDELGLSGPHSEEPPTQRGYPAAPPVTTFAVAARTTALGLWHELSVPSRRVPVLAALGGLALLGLLLTVTLYFAGRSRDPLSIGTASSVSDAGPPPVVLEPVLEPQPSAEPAAPVPDAFDASDAPDAESDAGPPPDAAPKPKPVRRWPIKKKKKKP